MSTRRVAGRLLPATTAVLIGCASTPRLLHLSVVDDATDRPLAGVAVDTRQVTTANFRPSTDANGQLTVSGVPSEAVPALTLTRPGYAPAVLLWDDSDGRVRVVSPALLDTFGLTPRHSQDGIWPTSDPVPVRLVPDPNDVTQRPGNRIAP